MADLALIEEAKNQGLSLVEQAGRMDVTDAPSADEASRLRMRVKAQIEAIEEARKQITRPLDESIKRAIEQQRAAQQPFLEADEHLKGLLAGWNEQEHRRIAREQAEAEQERARLENEAQRAAAEGRLDDAAELQIKRDSTGGTKKAHRPAGSQIRKTWKAEVTDFDALVKAVAENAMLPSNLLQVNQSALNALARAVDGKVSVPGVRFYQDTTVATTARF